MPPPERNARLCASDEDVVDGNVDELDEVADGAHDQEADTDSLADLDEFLAIGLCAPVDEQRALLDKVPGQVEDLLNLVAHLDGVVLLF